MRLRFGLPAALLAVAATGCLDDAERGNPFDPLSDAFRDAGTVAGTVTRLNPPFEGIGDATVHLVPLDAGVRLETRTTSEGRFAVPDVPTGRYLLTAEAPGFALEDDTVEVALGQPVEATLRLDGIPTVAQSVHTEHIERWWPGPLYRLVVEATVGDPDGLTDIERVALVIPDFGFEDTLTVTDDLARYRRVFDESELPAPLSELAGRRLDVEATDAAEVTGSAQGVQIVRIIQSTPIPVAPVGRETIGSLVPVLTWEPLGLSFAFTYRIQIVRVTPDVQVLVETFPDLPPTQTELQVPPGYLEDGGEYYWTVAVVDTFGNLSRSKEAGFIVAL